MHHGSGASLNLSCSYLLGYTRVNSNACPRSQELLSSSQLRFKLGSQCEKQTSEFWETYIHSLKCTLNSYEIKGYTFFRNLKAPGCSVSGALGD